MKIKKGDKLDIELPTSEGRLFNLKETHGKKVLLTFENILICGKKEKNMVDLGKSSKKKRGKFGILPKRGGVSPDQTLKEKTGNFSKH